MDDLEPLTLEEFYLEEIPEELENFTADDFNPEDDDWVLICAS